MQGSALALSRGTCFAYVGSLILRGCKVYCINKTRYLVNLAVGALAETLCVHPCALHARALAC